MRLTIIAVSILSLLTYTLKAQQFNGGVMGGLTVCKVTGSPAGGWKKVGFLVGGFVNLEISKNSAFQVELEYIQKGALENGNYVQGITDSYLLRLGYIEMPFLYQFKVSKWLSFELGPSVNFLLHHYEEINGAEQVSIPSFRTAGFSINAGVNIYISDLVYFNFRTNNSLLNIRTGTVTGYVWRFWAYGQYNDIFSFSLFFRLSKLGKNRPS